MTESLARLAAHSKIHNILCIAGCTPEEHSLIYTLFHDPVALSTLLMFFATLALWWTTRQATKLNEEQHVRSTRAFAYLSRFDIMDVRVDGPLELLRITPIFRNSGLSPTRNALISIDSREFAGDLPEDFNYPISTVASVAFVGPGAEVAAPFLDIPAPVVHRVRTGEAQFYIWGNITYRDIFKNTKPHSTDFCFRLVVIAGQTGFYFGFTPYGGRNRSDDDTRIVATPTDAFSSWLANVYDVLRRQ